MSDEPRTVRKVADFVLSSGKLRIADTSFFYDDYWDIDLEPGPYILSMIYDGDGLEDGFELSSTRHVTLGDKVAEIDFEFCLVGIYDQVKATEGFAAMTDAQWEAYYDSKAVSVSKGFALLHPTVELMVPIVRCSVGRADIYHLFDAGKVVGIRVDFDVQQDDEEEEDEEDADDDTEDEKEWKTEDWDDSGANYDT